MADNEQENEEQAPPAKEEKGGKKKPGIGLVVGLAVLVMVATPFITILAFRAMTGSEPEEEAKPDKPPIEVSLPQLQVNVADTNGTRYAQINIVVELSDEKMQDLFKEQTLDNPKGKLRRIMATAICVVSEKSLESLLSAGAKEKLSDELKTSLNDVLRNEAQGIITDIYFNGFLVQ